MYATRVREFVQIGVEQIAKWYAYLLRCVLRLSFGNFISFEIYCCCLPMVHYLYNRLFIQQNILENIGVTVHVNPAPR